MKTSRLLLAASAIAALISSCTRNIYAPYCQPVTLFNQQGEYQITAAVSDEFFNSGVSNYTDSTAALTAHTSTTKPQATTSWRKAHTP